MVVVQQTLNEEVVEQLLAEGGESELLDYKRTLDLNETSDVVELAKDIAAMQVDGGYIVVGADDAGKPTGDLPPEQASLFDESRLRSKLAKYLPEPFFLRSYVYRRGGNWIAAVGTLPNPSGYMIFKADGQYTAGKDQKVVFRAGEVFVRHGSASTRWSQHDTERIMKRIVESRKEEWRRENTDAIMSAIEKSDGGRIIAQGAAAAFTWRVDADTFNNSLIESLRTGDTLPVVMLLDQMSQDATVYFSSRNEEALDELRTMLNRLACTAATLLRFDKFDAFVRCVKTALSIYMTGFLNASGDVRGHQHNSYSVSSPQLWLEVIKRVAAVGAYAVRRENWRAVRVLALQATTDRYSTSLGEKQFLLRHAIKEASMANIFKDPQGGGRVGGELIFYANQVIEGEPCLRPDLPLEDYRLLKSVLEFDLLAVLVVSAEVKCFDNSFAYGSFVYWGMQQVDTLLARLILDEGMREELFSAKIDEQFLADTLRSIQVLASRTSMGSSWGGDTIRKFLTKYPAKEPAKY